MKKLREVFEKISPGQVVAFNGILDVEIATSSEDQYLAFKIYALVLEPIVFTAKWLRNTALSHATYASAIAYIDGSDGELDLSREPNFSRIHPPEIATLLLLASHSFNQLLEDKPRATALQEIETSIFNAVNHAS
jgi:hypothetical protein